MSKKTTTKTNSEAQLLALLKKVLPKAIADAAMADRIYHAVESELVAKAKVSAFEKFCDHVELPDLEPKTLADVKEQFSAAFGSGDVTIQPNKKEKTLEVEVSLPDGAQFHSEIKVRPVGSDDDGDPEATLKFIPFPVSLPGDPELAWLLAKRENLSPDEAGMALAKVEEEFWASKTGQKLLRDRVERNFPEFIARVPAGMLSEGGLKRHYKTPEAVRVHRTLGAPKPGRS